ncbi:hypothetical protein TrST_g13509 [Triparma strigata]|uniref:Kinesin motor domain-containing protein n=1 Tax=Triparma strigata TaxID=1606541 RepID=A0A9W7E4F9_9STRA|nr:hypothetical protein TrST_g13509 [Triparma strigata]
MEAIHVLLRVRPEASPDPKTPSHRPPQHMMTQMLSPYDSLQTPPPIPPSSSSYHTPRTPSAQNTAISFGGQSCVFIDDSKSLSITGHSGSNSSATPIKTSSSTPARSSTHKFTFDRVFSNTSTQEEVFDMCRPLVIDAVNGFHTTIFAYGCTGSGKTHTITGSKQNPGLIPRCVDLIFERLAGENIGIGILFVTYVELHNNSFYDLLAKENKGGIEIREAEGRGVYLSGVERMQVGNPAEVHKLIENGNEFRATSATLLNERSSRSHAILTLEMETMSGGEDNEKVRMGKLNIVDLAGSERVQMSGVVGEALAEASAINASLSALGDVLNSLSKMHRGSATPKKKAQYVPFRNSKLTHVLKDSLGGSCKTIMIATIRPGSAFYGQTLSTLRYASRARDIKNMPMRHSDGTGGEAKLAEAYRQINELREQLMGRGKEFDRLKNDPNTGSPESQRRLRGLQQKHASEMKDLKKKLSKVVRSKGGEIEQALSRAEAAEQEMDALRGEKARVEEEAREKVRALEEKAQQMVDQAKHSLNDDTRKTLKKLAKERKLLKDKNSELENQVSSMRKELQEISVHNNSNKSSGEFVGELQEQLKTLRAGLEHAVKQEDLAAEAKSWKARCLEAVEHLERMKHDSLNRKQRQAKLEKQIATLNAEIRNLSKQQEADKNNSSHRVAALSQENSELQNQVDAARKTHSMEREKFMEQQTKYKGLELKFDQMKRDLERSSGKIVDLQEQKKSDEYGWEREKKRMHEARLETVGEKSAIEGRNEYLERENTRLKSELHEEVKKREYAERESARNAPLTARVGKLAEENEMVKNESENLRSRVRRYEAESRHAASLELERDNLRSERDKYSIENGSLRAEVHQLRVSANGLNEDHSILQNDLKAAKNLNEDLKDAIEKTKNTNMELNSRLEEVLRDHKEVELDLNRTKTANDKLREDQEALGALCSSMKKTLNHLEKEKDSDSATHYTKSQQHKEEVSRLSAARQDMENQLGKLKTKVDSLQQANNDLQDTVSMHRGRSGALSGEITVLQENLARANAELNSQNERRLSSEEKLSAEQRASERLLRENEKYSAKISELTNEISGLRGARDGDVAAHKASLGAANAAAEREKLSREAAEHREEEFVRRIGLIQASLTQECGARKGAQAARDAAVIECDGLKMRLQESDGEVRKLKDIKLDLEKLVGDLKDDNHKARGSALALTMEIEGLREKMGETKHKLEDQNDEIKSRLGKNEAERQQLFLDNDELRRLISEKTTELVKAREDVTSLEKKIEECKEETSSHVKTGIQAVHDAHDHGFNEGLEKSRADMRGTVTKMQEEVKHVMADMVNISAAREKSDQTLKEHDEHFHMELKNLHEQLDGSSKEISTWKELVGEKEVFLSEERRKRERLEQDVQELRNKYEFEIRTKDEVVHQHADEVDTLRKRTMSLEKDLELTVRQKKEAVKEARRAAKKGKGDVKQAVNIVKEHVESGAAAEDLDLNKIFGRDLEDSGSEYSSITGASTPGGVSTPGSYFGGASTPDSRRELKTSPSFDFDGGPFSASSRHSLDHSPGTVPPSSSIGGDNVSPVQFSSDAGSSPNRKSVTFNPNSDDSK